MGSRSEGSTPVTSPADARVVAASKEEVAGADQIPALLAASPRERLQRLVEGLAFEDRAHRARVVSREP